jgi:hypothetical protein
MNLQAVVWKGQDWTDLAEEREKWQAFVNAARQRTFGFHKIRGISLFVEKVLAFQEILCPIESVSQNTTRLNNNSRYALSISLFFPLSDRTPQPSVKTHTVRSSLGIKKLQKHTRELSKLSSL